MKKQYDLKPCPFCGNPAEIVKGEPFSFAPYKLTYVVRCSSEWCLLVVLLLVDMVQNKMLLQIGTTDVNVISLLVMRKAIL